MIKEIMTYPYSGMLDRYKQELGIMNNSKDGYFSKKDKV